MAKRPGSATDPFWYKDAVFYELHVRAFKDSNGDGIGDFPGLMQKLDYVRDLGVTCLWLLPFYPSPLKDDGYDISDFTNVHPIYGTIDDFRAFLDAAHDRDLQVMIELVMNHTSDQHPWFQSSRQSPDSRNGIFMFGAIPTESTNKSELSSLTPRNPTGPGIPSPSSTTGIAFFPTSPT
jgi:glycosidase